MALFLVDAHTPGLSVERTMMVDSRNAANIVLDGVAAELVGEPGEVRDQKLGKHFGGDAGGFL